MFSKLTRLIMAFYRLIKYIFTNPSFVKSILSKIKKIALGEKELIPSYNEEGVILYGKELDFLEDPKFIAAYNRAIKASNMDFHIRYRVYVLLWVAEMAIKLKGDFIECGVARGFVSSAIMDYLDWDMQENKTYYLLDTFEGINKDFLTDAEKNNIGDVDSYNIEAIKTVYAKSYDDVVKNFEEWKNKKIIKGTVPLTLSSVKSKSISFLHIDMNCVKPEIEALNYFWPNLVPGAMVVLDDYGHSGHRMQKEACDNWAKENNTIILTLPTGQGLIIKQ